MADVLHALRITPLHPCLGAEVAGVDLAGPVDAEVFQAIVAAFETHSVLVFHDQRVDDASQMAFARRFGPLETTIASIGKENHLHPNVVDLSNLDPEGRQMGWEDRRMVYQSGNQLWHSDSSFKRVPAHASLLSGREVPPEGGETEFVSLRHAWDTLSPGLRAQLADRVAVHHFAYSRGLVASGLLEPEHEAALPPVRQALVRRNPVNDRAALFIGSHASHIEGMPVEEGRALLGELLAHATRPEHVLRHVWRQWDLVMWDNRAVLHRGRPWDSGRHRRVMRRTTVAGDGPTA